MTNRSTRTPKHPLKAATLATYRAAIFATYRAAIGQTFRHPKMHADKWKYRSGSLCSPRIDGVQICVDVGAELLPPLYVGVWVRLDRYDTQLALIPFRPTDNLLLMQARIEKALLKAHEKACRVIGKADDALDHTFDPHYIALDDMGTDDYTSTT